MHNYNYNYIKSENKQNKKKKLTKNKMKQTETKTSQQISSAITDRPDTEKNPSKTNIYIKISKLFRLCV